MSGIKVLLDTNIVIGLLKGNDKVVQLVFRSDLQLNEMAVSQITRMELLSYPAIQKKEMDKIQLFLDSITVILLSANIELKTIEYRRKQSGKLPDAIIAATALIYGLEVLSLDKSLQNNIRQFRQLV